MADPCNQVELIVSVARLPFMRKSLPRDRNDAALFIIIFRNQEHASFFFIFFPLEQIHAAMVRTAPSKQGVGILNSEGHMQEAGSIFVEACLHQYSYFQGRGVRGRVAVRAELIQASCRRAR